MHGVDDALEDTTNPVLDVPEEDNAESKLIWFGETRGTTDICKHRYETSQGIKKNQT